MPPVPREEERQGSGSGSKDPVTSSRSPCGKQEQWCLLISEIHLSVWPVCLGLTQECPSSPDVKEKVPSWVSIPLPLPFSPAQEGTELLVRGQGKQR